MTAAGNPGVVGATPAAEQSTPLPLSRRADQITQSGIASEPSPHPQTLALDAISHIQEILQANAMLVQQSAVLEQQLQTLLAERIALIERIAALEDQVAPSSPQHAGRAATGYPVPFRPLANLPAVLHHKRLEAIAPLPASKGRFPHPVISDEETLLGSTLRLANTDTDTPLADAVPIPQRSEGAITAPTASPLRDYTLIAQPFARFTDLGGFQSAVQALPGIHNVRVRRFAQGVLEMRVDYDGDAPLETLLRGLAQPVEEVLHDEPACLRIRLTPLRERGFPALS
jgi:hypothetical protein